MLQHFQPEGIVTPATQSSGDPFCPIDPNDDLHVGLLEIVSRRLRQYYDSEEPVQPRQGYENAFTVMYNMLRVIRNISPQKSDTKAKYLSQIYSTRVEMRQLAVQWGIQDDPALVSILANDNIKATRLLREVVQTKPNRKIAQALEGSYALSFLEFLNKAGLLTE
ncbi:hypothetical protein NLI96_g3650 [Meripilus lineatus]|uniref:Uncharacterized protein n=1 Tax=Meripilus lineatus TaxID=2056292 RepID=A0AAD5YIT6_9APHY|nr:hypothetical protein NLI96_g3650 [Physisporinus lineatus]